MNQAAIHPGSIPAAQVNAAAAVGGTQTAQAAAAAQAAANSAKRSVAPTMSSASHLIGGAPSPALVTQSRPYGAVNTSFMIGDYMTPPGSFPPAASTTQSYKP